MKLFSKKTKPVPTEKTMPSKTHKDERFKSVKNFIFEPWISEKATRGTGENKYVFAVPPKINKNIIKKEVENRFNVKVLSVNTVIKHGKSKQWRNKFGRKKDIKKAIVTLKSGDKIDLT